VRESLLSSRVMVGECSEIYRSVILPGVDIGRNCLIRNAVVDEGVAIPDGTRIGVDPSFDRKYFNVTGRGVVLVTGDMLARLDSAAARPAA